MAAEALAGLLVQEAVGLLVAKIIDIFKHVKNKSKNVSKLLELLEMLQPAVEVLKSSSQGGHLQVGGKWWTELEKQLKLSRDLAVASGHAHRLNFWATVKTSKESVKLYASILELMVKAQLPQMAAISRLLEIGHETLTAMKALQDKLDESLEDQLVLRDGFDRKTFTQNFAEANAEAFDAKAQDWPCSSADQSNVPQPRMVFGGGAVAMQLKKHLLSENCPKWAGLLGMGGIGKTFTARLIYHDSDVRKRFDGGAFWVTVSKDHSDPAYLFRLLLPQFPDQEVHLLLKKLENSESSSQVPDTVERLKSYVKSMLDRGGGRVLLVLDDVWQSDVLNCLDVFSESKEGVILITTRLESVLTRVKEPFKVPPLPRKDSWQLFSWHAFRGQNIPKNVKSIAEQVAGKCGGLPLALEVIGATMANVTVLPSEEVLGMTIRQKWQNSLDYLVENADGSYNMLYTNHSDADAQYDKLYNTLQLSVEDLPQQLDFRLQDCLFTFAAFPEDWEIQTEELIRMWIAEGFVQNDEDSLFSSELKAKFILGYLAGRSLVELMESGTRCRIHDVMRHLVQLNLEGRYCKGTSGSIRKDFARECFYFPGLHMSRFPRPCRVPKGAHAKRISLHTNRLQQLPTCDEFDSPDLQVLIMSYNMHLDLHSPAFFQNLSKLRLLILRSINVLQLHDELFLELKSLVLLDLTDCGSLEHLSDAINGSHSLEFLSLKGCRSLRTLPPLSNLSKLKYFSANLYEDACTLPPNLQYLDLYLETYGVEEDIQANRNAALCSSVSTLPRLEHFSLEYVQPSLNHSENRPKIWEKCKNFSSLKSFRICGYEVAGADARVRDTLSSRHVIWRFGPMMMPNLIKLDINMRYTLHTIRYGNLQSQFLESIAHLRRLRQLKISTAGLDKIYDALEYLFTPPESLAHLDLFELLTSYRKVTGWDQFPPVMLERRTAGDLKIVCSHKPGFSPLERLT